MATDIQDSLAKPARARTDSPRGRTNDTGGNQQLIVAELDPREEEDVRQFFEEASKLRIMVTGATGVGKSTILNALVGAKVFDVDRKTKQRVTTKVTEKICQKDGIEIIAIDCPGLHDGTENEMQYIQEMKDAIDKNSGIDLLLYCKKMDDTRADVVSDVDIIKKLTDGLGAEVWTHALFVLTFANTYERMLEKTRKLSKDKIKKEFEARKKEWKTVIEDSMKKCEVKCRVKVCPAGYKKPQLCGRPYWLSDFWASAYKVINKDDGDEMAAATFVRLNQTRIVQEQVVASQDENFERDLQDQNIVMTSKVKKALGITAVAGGSAAIGATIGATIGAVFIGVISFGPAAGVGLVLGGFIGAAVGTAVGGAIVSLYAKHKKKKLAKAAAAVAPTVTPDVTPDVTTAVTPAETTTVTTAETTAVTTAETTAVAPDMTTDVTPAVAPAMAPTKAPPKTE